MADVKITDLSASAGLSGADLIEVVDDPAGTPASEKATITQVAAFVDANTAHAARHATGGGDAITPADIGAATSSDITSAITAHNSTADAHNADVIEYTPVASSVLDNAGVDNVGDAIDAIDARITAGELVTIAPLTATATLDDSSNRVHGVVDTSGGAVTITIPDTLSPGYTLTQRVDDLTNDLTFASTGDDLVLYRYGGGSETGTGTSKTVSVDVVGSLVTILFESDEVCVITILEPA